MKKYNLYNFEKVQNYLEELNSQEKINLVENNFYISGTYQTITAKFEFEKSYYKLFIMDSLKSMRYTFVLYLYNKQECKFIECNIRENQIFDNIYSFVGDLLK